MTPGIEVFGRSAVLVEQPEPARRRTRWLGLGALAVAVACAVLTGLGVDAASTDSESVALVFAIAAIGASILSFLLGGAALVTGRGAAVGAVAMLLAIVANPWVLLHILEFFSTFVG